MMDEQLKRHYPILCFVMAVMSFFFFYTLYKSEHDAMVELEVEYDYAMESKKTELMLYKRQLQKCYSYRKETK